ncbi:hypothetical protein [Sphingobacterium sp. IITKGP-BTPF85]|uniref:hypothetical protein n=1 Tax=Sphingobacterium sp. IITKGP-BTPF85 TaxID=1338009 RepID=UPI000389F232|nr:hypothetical protein [Sphingobacterium sp. IITKGP-BTPF85]KKX47955.1 hypothetical protein L950_0223710 [Sphingobacterium sp. IITKGP-BTPF85]
MQGLVDLAGGKEAFTEQLNDFLIIITLIAPTNPIYNHPHPIMPAVSHHAINH